MKISVSDARYAFRYVLLYLKAKKDTLQIRFLILQNQKLGLKQSLFRLQKHMFANSVRTHHAWMHVPQAH